MPTLRYHHKFVFSVLIVLGILAGLLAVAQDQETLRIESEYGAEDLRFPAYLAALVGAAATGGNDYQVLSNGDQIFPAMLASINTARQRISFESYIYEKGSVGEQFTAALEAASRRGVQVNLVVDAIGSGRMPTEWRDRLRAAGVQIGEFGKPRWYTLEELNYRTHRKILVADARVGYTGGVGVADHWLGHAQDRDHWRDMMVRIEGPLARLMEAAFYENFIETMAPVRPILDLPPEGGSHGMGTPDGGSRGRGTADGGSQSPGAPTPPAPRDSAFELRSSPSGGSNDLKRLYLIAIASARRTLDICSPYFITDESTEWALVQAVKRGVRVRILVEGDITDAKPVKYASRYAYEGFISQGIEIYEFQPTMMHTKAMIVDGILSVFGSANFDNRSLELNDEMNVSATDRGLARRLFDEFESDLSRARRLDLDSWRGRSTLEKVREYFWSYFGEVF